MSTHSNSTDVVCSQPSNCLLLLESLTDKATEVSSQRPSKVMTLLLATLSSLKWRFDTLHTDSSNLVTQHFLMVLGKYLGQGVQLLDLWLVGGQKKKLQVLVAKLNALVELFESAMHVDPEDLFCLDKTHERWETLHKVTETIVTEDSKSLQADLERLTTKLAIGRASLKDSQAYRHHTMRTLQVGAGAIYYLLFRDAAIQQSKLHCEHPDVESTKALWNMVDSRLVSPLYQSLLVSIHYTSMMFVPRIAPHFMDFNRRPKSDYLLHSGKHYIEQLQEEPANHFVSFSQSMDPDKRRVPVRILSPFDLPLGDRLRDEGRSWFSLCCDGRDYRMQDVRRLILHIHGGGFMAMSSNSHQNYTRKWAQDTMTPILSVDYRLSPESRYPDALDDCWQVYMWLREYSKKYLGISADKVVLAGDSAGGNLALGVTLRCVKSYGKIPDGLLLSYPGVSLDMSRYTPSLAYSMEDSLLHYELMQLIRQSYLRPEDDPRSDAFVSPLLAERCDLEQFPPVRMLVCSNDPLLDNCYRMAEKLIAAGVDVKIAKFEGMVHGALNFDLAMGVKDARLLVQKGSQYLKELLENQCQ